VYRKAQRHKKIKNLARAYGTAILSLPFKPAEKMLLRTVTALVADEFHRGGDTPFDVNTYMIQAATAATPRVAPNERWVAEAVRRLSRDWRTFYRMAVFYASVSISKHTQWEMRP
jgi:hypothetical protein